MSVRISPQEMRQQDTMSSVESSTFVVPFVAMQRRSLMASTAPKAQQEPHVLWSRMCPIEGQEGQAVRESKAEGAT